jgi:hypothetical protein
VPARETIPQIEKSTVLDGPPTPGVSFFSSEPSTILRSGGVVGALSAGASTVSMWPGSASMLGSF